MIIICEKCSTKFNLDESIIKKQGSKVRCSICKHVFTALPPSLKDSKPEPPSPSLEQHDQQKKPSQKTSEISIRDEDIEFDDAPESASYDEDTTDKEETDFSIPATISPDDDQFTDDLDFNDDMFEIDVDVNDEASQDDDINFDDNFDFDDDLTIDGEDLLKDDMEIKDELSMDSDDLFQDDLTLLEDEEDAKTDGDLSMDSDDMFQDDLTLLEDEEDAKTDGDLSMDSDDMFQDDLTLLEDEEDAKIDGDLSMDSDDLFQDDLTLLEDEEDAKTDGDLSMDSDDMFQDDLTLLEDEEDAKTDGDLSMDSDDMFQDDLTLLEDEEDAKIDGDLSMDSDDMFQDDLTLLEDEEDAKIDGDLSMDSDDMFQDDLTLLEDEEDAKTDSDLSMDSDDMFQDDLTLLEDEEDAKTDSDLSMDSDDLFEEDLFEDDLILEENDFLEEGLILEMENDNSPVINNGEMTEKDSSKDKSLKNEENIIFDDELDLTDDIELDEAFPQHKMDFDEIDDLLEQNDEQTLEQDALPEITPSSTENLEDHDTKTAGKSDKEGLQYYLKKESIETHSLGDIERSDSLESLEKRHIKAKKKSKTGMFLAFILLLLIILIAGYAATIMTGTQIPYISEIKIPYLTDYLSPPPPPPVRLSPDQKTVNGRFIVNSNSGTLFIITGSIVNNSTISCTHVKIKATLINKEKISIKNKEVYCDNIITEEELKTISIMEIDKLLNKIDSKNKSVIKPGEARPFMVVFEDLPENLENFTVTVSDFIRDIPKK